MDNQSCFFGKKLDKTIKLRRLVLYEVLIGAKMGLLCGGLLYVVSFFGLVITVSP